MEDTGNTPLQAASVEDLEGKANSILHHAGGPSALIMDPCQYFKSPVFHHIIAICENLRSINVSKELRPGSADRRALIA